MDKNPLVAEYERNQIQIAKLNSSIEMAVSTEMKKLKKLNQDNENIREAILEAMEKNDVDKFDGDLIAITRVKATERTTFDSKKFAEERPKTYAKYLRKTAVKASIRIKLKA